MAILHIALFVLPLFVMAGLAALLVWPLMGIGEDSGSTEDESGGGIGDRRPRPRPRRGPHGGGGVAPPIPRVRVGVMARQAARRSRAGSRHG